MYSFLIVRFPASLGGGDSPGAKTGWWQPEYQNRMCVKHVFWLFVWILACPKMCGLFLIARHLSFLWLTWTYFFWFSLSWPVFGNIDTTLWLMVFVAGYLCRHFGVSAKNRQKMKVSPSEFSAFDSTHTCCVRQKEEGSERKLKLKLNRAFSSRALSLYLKLTVIRVICIIAILWWDVWLAQGHTTTKRQRQIPSRFLAPNLMLIPEGHSLVVLTDIGILWW